MAFQVSETTSRNRSLLSLYELTQKVAAAERPEEIYEAALVCLRDCLGVEKSSLLLLDESGVMRFRAWLDLSADYRKAVDGHSPWLPGTENPEPVLVRDVRADLALAPFREVIEAENVRALAFIPLVLAGRLLGKFMLYYPQPHDFDAEEVLTAQTIASQVAFAIDHRESVQEHERVAAILRSSLVGFFEMDSEGHLLTVSRRFSELVGWSSDELTKTDVFAITHPEDLAPTRDAIQGLRDGGDYYAIEKRFIRPNGSIVWVSNSVSAIRDSSGTLRGAVALSTDITERRLAEEELRQSEQRYRDLIRALGLAVYTTDAAGRITMYNEAAAELWGRQPKLGTDLWCGSWRIYHIEDGSEMPLDQCPMAVALKEGRPVRDQEILVERPDGSRAVVLPYPTPMRDVNGNLIGAVNVLLDITERKEAEEAALYLGAIVTSSADAIVSKNLDGIITSWNKGAEKLFGYSAEEAVGKSIRMIMPPERQSEEDDFLARLRRGESIENFETIRQRKDGSQIPISLSVSPVRDRNGVIIGASKIARDISERRAAEEAIRQSMAIKDQFLGLVSHELRTPIASIYGNGLLLQRRGEHLAPEDRSQSLADIVTESKKLQSIIENLLMLTRLEAGQLEETEPLSLAPIIETEIAELQRSHPERRVTFSPGLDVPPAIGQQTLISLVLRNLLANAEKYSPPETDIEVSLRRNEVGLPEISIRDKGIGMEPDDLEEIFTPFYRSQRARITAKGMGVGLAVCKRVIEAHGGTIAVNSQPDQGSEFVLCLRPADPEGPA